MRHSLVLLVVLTAALAACSGAEDKIEDKFNLSLTYAANVFDAGCVSQTQPGYLRVYVEGLGISSTEHQSYEIFMPGTPGGTSLEEIPYGDQHQIVVEYYPIDAATNQPQATPTARGKSEPMKVEEDDALQEVTVMLSCTTGVTPTSDHGGTITSLQQARVGASVTQLYDGTILIAGGAIVEDGDDPYNLEGALILNTAELYNPDTGTFIQIQTPMNMPRAYHTATLLPNGAVLIAGGYSDIDDKPTPINHVEYFANQGFFADSPMASSRANHTATLLSNSSGLVLFVGGKGDIGSWEVYQFQTGSLSSAQPMNGTNKVRYNHVAVTIPNGLGDGYDGVFILGGENDDGIVSNVEVYSSAQTKLLTSTIPMAGGGRTLLTASYVPSQKFMYVIGGFTDTAHSVPSSVINIYSVAMNNFRSDQMDLGTARAGHFSYTMEDGSVVIGGGIGPDGVALDSIERIYVAAPQADGKRPIVIEELTNAAGVLSSPRALASTLLMSNGLLYIVGGIDDTGASLNTVDLYNY